MGSSSPMLNHSYCRVPSQQTECDSRLGVKKQFGFLGMEASSPVVSENLLIQGNPEDRFVCFRTISSEQDLLFVEAKQQMPEVFTLFPHFAWSQRFCAKFSKKVPIMILETPAWSSQLWSTLAMRMSIQQPVLLTWRRDLIKNSKKKVHPLVQ